MTKAQWFAGAVAGLDDEPDPFTAPIEEVGKRIDLKDARAALELRLVELLARESRLFERNVTCVIKERADTCCHACPISKAHDRNDQLGLLCRIGREQETTLTELAVMRCRVDQ